MNVLFERGLESVAAELAGMGYSMHPLKSGVRADAVLFTSDARGALEVNAARSGASIVCVRGMSAGEIASSLARRGCKPLF